MDRKILLHLKDGNKIYSESELIEEGKRQEKEGVKPMYCFWDYKHNEPITSAGWLVYSTYEDGCGVVYRIQGDGDYRLVTGWQGEFALV